MATRIKKGMKKEIRLDLRDESVTIMEVADKHGIASASVRKIAEAMGPRVFAGILKRGHLLRGARAAFTRVSGKSKEPVVAKASRSRITPKKKNLVLKGLRHSEFKSFKDLASKAGVSAPSVKSIAAERYGEHKMRRLILTGFKQRGNRSKETVLLDTVKPLERVAMESTAPQPGNRISRSSQVTLTLKADGRLESYESHGEVNVMVFKRA